MLGRQYVALGLKPAVVTLVDDASVLFIDADNLSTMCYFSEDEDEDEHDDSASCEAPNEFYDDDAHKVYDECGDVRVLVADKQTVITPVLSPDTLIMCSVSHSGSTTALLYSSGYFRVIMEPKGTDTVSMNKGETPKELAAETWIVTDTHLIMGGTVDAADPAGDALTDAHIYVYELPDLKTPVARHVNPLNQRELHVMAVSADNETIVCASNTCVWHFAVMENKFRNGVYWDVPDVHSLAVDACRIALSYYPRELLQPRVQVRRFSAPQEILEEFATQDDGGLPQSSDVKVCINKRGLVVTCGGLVQMYALPET